MVEGLKRSLLSAPEPLTAGHAVSDFDSGVVSLDDWLKRRAIQNQASGASRSFVVCDGRPVVAYYALAASAVAASAVAASAVAADAAPGRFKRSMPDPIPVVVLARLGVARGYQGRGLGRSLFQDAALRVLHAADAVGIRGLLVHAVSEEAKAFYLRLGLVVSPIEPMSLMVTVADLKAALNP